MRNPNNKQNIIRAIGKELVPASFTLLHAEGDVDVLIALTGVNAAKERVTAVVGNDTDLLILLLHHLPPEARDLYFETSTKSRALSTKYWHINFIKRSLEQVCHSILVDHAFLGCDTTSRLFGIGKQAVLPFLKSHEEFRNNCEVFLNPRSTKEEVQQAGENLLLCFYKATKGEVLSKARCRVFLEKLNSSKTLTFVNPGRLPPTPSAVKFHSYRVFYQVMEWRNTASELDPKDWGWRLRDGRLTPIMTDIGPTPPHLLNVIRCSCTRSNCDSSRCSCQKNGLPCTLACKDCQGIACSNKDVFVDNDEEDDV